MEERKSKILSEIDRDREELEELSRKIPTMIRNWDLRNFMRLVISVMY